MRVKFSNNIFVYGASKELYDWCQENLIVTNPTYEQLMRLGKEEQVIRRHVPNKLKLFVERGLDLIIPAGCLTAIWRFVKNSPYELAFNHPKQIECPDKEISMPLYGYQEEAVRALMTAKSGILESPAGSGKTQIGIELAKRIGLNTLWLTHTGDLLSQTVKRIKLLYPNMPVGTITEGEVKMVENGITVSTIQTLIKVDKEIYADKFGTVICDETHKVVGAPTLMKMFGGLVEKIPARHKFGLSATLSRSDSLIKSMYAIIGCNPKGEFAPTFSIDRSKTNTLTAIHNRVDLQTPFDYSCIGPDGVFDFIALVNFLSTNEERNNAIVNNIVKTFEVHKKQIVLCSRIEQCEILVNKLQEKGLNAKLLVGKVTPKKRKEILDMKNDFDVIVATYSLAKEGLDLPCLSALHLGMLTGDKVATIQSAGRIERVFEGKPYPEIYDYVDVNYSYCIGKYKKRALWLKRR